MTRSQTLFHLINFKMDHLSQCFLIKRSKDHCTIETIDKLRLKVLLDRSLNLLTDRVILHRSSRFGMEAHFCRTTNQISSQVGSHDDNRMAEINLATKRICQTPLF